MSGKYYKLKKFSSDSYIPFPEKGINFKTASLDWFGDNLIDDIKTFTNTYSHVSVPQKIYSMLQKLLIKYSLINYKLEFLTLICATQRSYLMFLKHYEDKEDGLEIDFQNKKKDLKELINVLEGYLFANDRNNLHSISFKFNKEEPTVPINNFFVMEDIYSSICEGFNITKDNFHKRKDELLSEVNKFDYNRGADYIKYNMSVLLFKLVGDNCKTQSDAIMFVILFLHLSQIKANKNNLSSQIEFSEGDIWETESDDIKNMRLYILRSKNFLL